MKPIFIKLTTKTNGSYHLNVANVIDMVRGNTETYIKTMDGNTYAAVETPSEILELIKQS